MPGWVNTPEEEKAWKRAKAIVREQRGKKEGSFTDSDWGLVTHVAKNILKSSVLTSHDQDGLIYRLAKVQRHLEVRASKKKADDKLPNASKVVVSALKRVMSFGGQAIAAFRKTEGSDMILEEAEEMAEELNQIADQLEDLLNRMRGN